MTEAAEMRLLRGKKRRAVITPEMPLEALPQLLTQEEVAAWTQKGSRTVYRWVYTSTPKRRKKLKTVQVGGLRMVSRAALKEFLGL